MWLAFSSYLLGDILSVFVNTVRVWPFTLVIIIDYSLIVDYYV